jgi:hypothetical protein
MHTKETKMAAQILFGALFAAPSADITVVVVFDQYWVSKHV